ncbi:MAG TPA: hypothetical protein VFW50_39120 [Streptosporangiaceae bacterium]|nr:hypothetical protein [Streptosporangiaceae bacterium]
MAHLDTEVLAEFRVGLITGRRGARITAHLAGCDRCTALDDQLAGVSALLAAVSLPAVPDSVARRLDTVLAAEAARPEQVKTDQAERGDADHPAHPATGRTRRPRPRLRLSLRVLAPAAAVVVAAGGYGLSQLAGSGGQVTASSGSSAERAAGQAPNAASSHANRIKSPVVRGAEGTAPQAHRLTPGNFPLVAGTVDFSADPATLKQQVERELRTPSPTKAAPTAVPVTSQLRGCVQNLTHGVGLLRVESGRFRGKPATLVVARTGPDDTAWIAGPGCSATSRDVLAMTAVSAGTSGP